ncbi:putative SMODS and SLOG-associating 2TM effector domain-containing protein [Paraburkholderia sacchari]|uniref:hypothetical protein n=1 Tax=Paraburkholderia sacchari TaxID=159450 RepID=UPI0039A47CBB
MPDAPTNPEDFFEMSLDGHVQLLDEAGRPLVGLRPNLCGLADVAASIHAHARELSDDQLEQTIQWLKAIKMRDRVSSRPSDEFFSVLSELRNSPEQIELQRRGHRKLLLAKGVSMLLGFVLIAAVGLVIARSWVALGLAVIVALALFVVGERGTVTAIKIFKEQEQRHLWTSIRHARTVAESNQAGIFAYLRGATFGTPGFSEEGARAAMRAERERLTDALYADPDYYLRF